MLEKRTKCAITGGYSISLKASKKESTVSIARASNRVITYHRATLEKLEKGNGRVLNTD